MRILSKLLASGIIAATLFGCGGSTDVAEAELTGFIPAEAKAVVSIDLNSLKTKAGSIDKVFEGAANPEELKQLFESAAYVYFTVLQKGDEGISVLGLARLSDASALKKQLGDVVQTTEEVEIYALTHKVRNLTTTTIADSEETEMKVVETEEIYGYAGVKNNIVMTLTSPNMKTIDEGAIQQLVGHFTASEINLLSAEPTFVDVMAKQKDFSVWLSGSFKANEETMKLLPRQYKSFLQEVSLEGSYTSATLDFENGAIVGDYFFQGNQEYINKYAGLVKPNLEETTLNQFKVVEPALVFTSAFDPVKTLAFIKENGGDEDLNETINSDELGITTDDLFAMLNGDVLISIGNIDIATQDANVEILIGVQDEMKAKSLLDILVAKGQLEAKEDYYSQTAGGATVLIAVIDNTLIITKDNEFGQALIKGEGEVNTSLSEKVKSNSSLLFINPSQIPYQALATFGMISEDDVAQIDKIESIEFVGNQGADGKSTGSLDLKLKDKETNSLQLINKALNK
jgi:hypothetical protein